MFLPLTLLLFSAIALALLVPGVNLLVVAGLSLRAEESDGSGVIAVARGHHSFNRLFIRERGKLIAEGSGYAE